MSMALPKAVLGQKDSDPGKASNTAFSVSHPGTSPAEQVYMPNIFPQELEVGKYETNILCNIYSFFFLIMYSISGLGNMNLPDARTKNELQLFEPK